MDPAEYGAGTVSVACGIGSFSAQAKSDRNGLVDLAAAAVLLDRRCVAESFAALQLQIAADVDHLGCIIVRPQHGAAVWRGRRRDREVARRRYQLRPAAVERDVGDDASAVATVDTDIGARQRQVAASPCWFSFSTGF